LKRGVVDIGFGEQTLTELSDDYRTMGVVVGVHWINILHKVWVKVAIFVVAAAWLSFAFLGMLSIRMLEENENFSGEDTFLMKSLHGMTDFDPMKNQIRIAFGVEGLESRRVWHDDYGVVEYFDVAFHGQAQQQWLLDYCEMVRNWQSADQVNRTLVTSGGGVQCIFEHFRDYVLSPSSGIDNASYPLMMPGADSSDDDDAQKAFYCEEFYRWYHLSDEGASHRNSFSTDIRIDGEMECEMTSVTLEVISAANFWSLQSEADLEEAVWREFMDFSRAACEAALGDDDKLCRPRISSPRWSWSEGYAAYWTSARGSVITAFPIIFVILMLVLNNWIMALLCCINVLCIMMSVLGVIGMIGWRFGLTECASVVLVIGFSVDYCVHISHGYIVAPLKHNREIRCQFSLLQNGHAIVSSATVSILSTFPVLLNPNEVMFWKMGFLTVMTILFSILFSFSLFTLLLATIAPEGNGGKLWGRKPLEDEGNHIDVAHGANAIHV